MYLCIYLSIYLSIHLSIYLYLCLSNCLCVSLSDLSLPPPPSLSLSVCLSLPFLVFYPLPSNITQFPNFCSYNSSPPTHTHTSQFAPSPSSRCSVPGLSNDTFERRGLYQEELINWTLPWTDFDPDDDTNPWGSAQCEVYVNRLVKIEHPCPRAASNTC